MHDFIEGKPAEIDGVMPPVPVIVSQEEDQSHFQTEEAPAVEHSTSTTSSLSAPCPGSRHMSLEVETSSEASSGQGRRSIIGLSDTELLKCAFSYPQTEGATESPEINGEHFHLLSLTHDLLDML